MMVNNRLDHESGDDLISRHFKRRREAAFKAMLLYMGAGALVYATFILAMCAAPYIT